MTTTRPTRTPLADRSRTTTRDEERSLLVPVVLSALLLAWSVVANLALGERGYLARNLALGALLLWWAARRQGMSADELGLAVGPPLRVGVRVGLVAVLAVTVVVTIGVLVRDTLPFVEVLLADDRAEMGPGELAWNVLLRIPLGTAVFEELVFRGVLLAVLLRVLGRTLAANWAAVVFGLWHVAPTMVALEINDVAVRSSTGLVAILGAVAVTTVAGWLFTWLRWRGAHLAAPVLAHWATNAVGLIAAATTGGRFG